MRIVSPPSPTHIAQVRGRRTIENPVKAKLRPGLAKVLEKTPPTAEQYGCQGDFQLLDDIQVQVLLDHIRSTRNTNVTAARRLPSQLQGTLRSAIDEVKGCPAGPHPGCAFLMGKNVHGCVERSVFWPGALALVEHPFAHDVRTDALGGAAKQVIDRAGLSSRSESEILAEVLLIEDPRHERTPLGAPVLVLRPVPILDGHSFRRHVAIEGKSDVDEYLAHESPFPWTTGGIRGRRFVRDESSRNACRCSRHCGPYDLPNRYSRRLEVVEAEHIDAKMVRRDALAVE